MVRSILEMLQRRKLVFGLTLIIGLCLVVFLIQRIPRTYEATAQVLTVNGSQGRDASVSSIDLPAVAVSTEVLERVRRKLNLPLSLLDMKRGVKARVMVRSSIMTISFRDVTPERAVSVVNSIADELTKYYGEIALGRSNKTVRQLDHAITASRGQLNRILAQEAALPRAAVVFQSNDNTPDSSSATLNGLLADRATAAATLAADSLAFEGARSESNGPIGQGVARQEILEADAGYVETQKRLASDRANLSSAEAQYTDAYPEMAGLRERVARSQADVAAAAQRALASANGASASVAAGNKDFDRVQALVAGDRVRVNELDSLIADMRAKAAKVEHLRQTGTWLATQQQSAQANYLALNTRRTAAVADGAEDLSTGSLVVADRSVAADAAVVGLSRTRLAIIAAILLFSLAFGCAFMADLLDSSLRDSKRIANFYGKAPIVTLSKEA